MRKFLSIFLSVLFFLGWGLFYILDIYSLGILVKEGCFPNGGKPADMNIWLWCASQIIFILITGLFVRKWARMAHNSSILTKLKILVFSFVFFVLWILLYFGVMLLSVQLGIAHTECFF